MLEGCTDRRQRALHFGRLRVVVPADVEDRRATGFRPGEARFSVDARRVCTAVDWPENAAITVISREITAVTMSAVDCTITAASEITAVSTPHTPLTFVTRGLRIVMERFRRRAG